MTDVFRNIEFFSADDEVCYQAEGGEVFRLTEDSKDIIHYVIDRFREFYPGAIDACDEIFKRCQANRPYYNYRVVERICKCNFSNPDKSDRDIDASGNFRFEHVPCPLRRNGCKYENIICHPRFESNISAAEMRVLKLLYDGLSRINIADELCLSEHTVDNHIRNMRVRLGLSKESELIAYASKHHLIKE